MNILVLSAHPDDLEMMAGGSVASWVRAGHKVHGLTLTNGSWRNAAGEVIRQGQDAIAEEKKAASLLGYAVENLDQQAMDLRWEDRWVGEVLKRIEHHGIDTLVCPFEGDVHHDHEVVSRVAMSASRRIPRVLMGQINWYLRQPFAPNVFVDITHTWDEKIAALECYEGEWARAGKDWLPWLDETTRGYGRMIGVGRAEGFVSRKFLW